MDKKMGIRFGKGLILTASMFLIAGCATLQLTETELSKIPSLLVLRNEPGVSLVASDSTPSSQSIRKDTSVFSTKFQLSVSQLIEDKFREGVYSQIPYWPKMQKSDTPLKRSIMNGRPMPNGENYILGIDLSDISLHEFTMFFVPQGGISFRVFGAATIIDPHGKLIFLEAIAYDSKNYKRYISLENYRSKEAVKYVKEEADFAAEKITSSLIASFKNKKITMLNAAR